MQAPLDYRRLAKKHNKPDGGATVDVESAPENFRSIGDRP
jgi:hypothetical protein